MRKITTIFTLLVLSGCASQVVLIAQDTKQYEMKVDHLAKRLSTTIDGVSYSGAIVGSRAVAFGTAQTLGLTPTSTTMVMAGNDGRAILAATTGEYLECAYTKSGRNVAGSCVSNSGRKFVMTTL